MLPDVFGPRLVLPHLPGEPIADELARQAGWQLVVDNSGQAYSSYVSERTWQVSDDLYVQMVADQLTECCALMVSGSDSAAVDEFTRALSAALSPLSREAILAPLDPDPDPDRLTRVRSVVVLGLGGPEAFDEAFAS